MATFIAALLIAIGLQTRPFQGEMAEAPKLPYVTDNACPGEYCTVGSWKLMESVPIYDTWKPNRHQFARIMSGQTVIARTGVVVTSRPGTIRLDRDLPESNLKRGDIILTYAYRGEGFSEAWFHGNYYSD